MQFVWICIQETTPLKAEIEQPVALHKVCACVFCMCAWVL